MAFERRTALNFSIRFSTYALNSFQYFWLKDNYIIFNLKKKKHRSELK